MQITHLTINNFQGLRSADIALRAPVALIAGHNGAGKSSLRDAIALALNAEHPRVKLKGDLGRLVTEGTKAADIALSMADGQHYGVKVSAAGKVDDSNAGQAGHFALPFVIDSALFGRISADERRTLLFALTGCSATAGVVRDKLAKRGADADKIEAVLPMLRAGFPDAAEAAKKRATEAKGAWRGVTGETYGEKKAANWGAVAPNVDEDQLDGLKSELAALDVELDKTLTDIGAKQEQARTAANAAQQRQMLKGKADRIPRIKAKMESDQGEVTAWTAKVERLRESQHSQSAMPCPCCNAMLVERGGQLVEAGPLAHGTDDDLAKLPEYEQALALYQRALDNDRRDLADAESAAAQLATLPTDADQAAHQLDLSEINNRATQLRTRKRELVDQITAMQVDQKRANEAVALTDKASQHHADVQSWLVIADALSPDGIPGELLADALVPVNKLLQGRSLMAGWGDSAPVRITPDMRMTLDGRDYALLSESERWRVDCVVTLVIAELSGLKLVLLDRFDVLDLTGRRELIMLLDDCAHMGVIETAIVTGTMKAAPAGLPANVESFWIERGELLAYDRLDTRAAA